MMNCECYAVSGWMFSGGRGICGIKGPPFFSLFYFVDGGVLLQSGKQTNNLQSLWTSYAPSYPWISCLGRFSL